MQQGEQAVGHRASEVAWQKCAKVGVIDHDATPPRYGTVRVDGDDGLLGNKRLEGPPKQIYPRGDAKGEVDEYEHREAL